MVTDFGGDRRNRTFQPVKATYPRPRQAGLAKAQGLQDLAETGGLEPTAPVSRVQRFQDVAACPLPSSPCILNTKGVFPLLHPGFFL